MWTAKTVRERGKGWGRKTRSSRRKITVDRSSRSKDEVKKFWVDLDGQAHSICWEMRWGLRRVKDNSEDCGLESGRRSTHSLWWGHLSTGQICEPIGQGKDQNSKSKVWILWHWGGRREGRQNYHKTETICNCYNNIGAEGRWRRTEVLWWCQWARWLVKQGTAQKLSEARNKSLCCHLGQSDTKFP